METAGKLSVTVALRLGEIGRYVRRRCRDDDDGTGRQRVLPAPEVGQRDLLGIEHGDVHEADLPTGQCRQGALFVVVAVQQVAESARTAQPPWP